MNSGSEIKRFSSRWAINALSLSPDGGTLLVDDGRVLNVETGHVRTVIDGAAGPTAFAPNGAMFCCCRFLQDRDYVVVTVYDALTFEVVHEIGTGLGQPLSLAFSGDSERLAVVWNEDVEDSSNPNCTLSIVTLHDGSIIEHRVGCSTAIFGADTSSRSGLVTIDTSEAKMRDADTGQELRANLWPESASPLDPILAVSFDGRTVAKGGRDGSLDWATVTDLEVHKHIGAHSGWVRDVIIRDETIASCGNDSVIRLWDSNTAALRRRLGWTRPVFDAVSFVDESARVCAITSNGTGCLWDGPQVAVHRRAVQRCVVGRPIHNSSLARYVYECGFGSMNEMVGGTERHGRPVTVSSRGLMADLFQAGPTIPLRDPRYPVTVFDVACPSLQPSQVMFSCEGELLGVVADDGTIAILSVYDGNEVARLHLSEEPNVLLLCAATGSMVTANCDGFTEIDFASGRVIWRINARRDIDVLAANASLDVVAFGSSYDDRLHVARRGERKRPRTLIGHQAGINCAAVSPDGEQIATGSNDGTVRLWDSNSGKQLATFALLPNDEWAVERLGHPPLLSGGAGAFLANNAT